MVSKTSLAPAVEKLLDESMTSAWAVANAADVLASSNAPDRAKADIAREALFLAASRVAGRDLRSLADLIAWVAPLPGGVDIVKLLAAIDSADAADDLVAVLLLHVARAVAERVLGARGASVPFEDAAVESLDRALVREWKRLRTKQPHEWLYHPRKTSLSEVTTRKFLLDMLSASSQFKHDAAAGLITCDLNVTMKAGQRHKRLDVVVGRPAEPVGNAEDPANPLRKAKVAEPLLTLEVKACMTSHRQATPRLLDELRSSLEVVKGPDARTIPVALVIVNIAETFTNPLNLPGPNTHETRDIERLFRKLVERVHLDRGSGTEVAYGGVGIVVVDTDNERRIAEASREGRVPTTHTYERAIGRAARLYDALAVTMR